MIAVILEMTLLTPNSVQSYLVTAGVSVGQVARMNFLTPRLDLQPSPTPQRT